MFEIVFKVRYLALDIHKECIVKILSALFVVFSLNAVAGEFYPLSCDFKGPINYWPGTSMKSWTADACSVIINPSERDLCLKNILKGPNVTDDEGADAQKFYCQSGDIVSVARCSLVVLKAVACYGGATDVPLECGGIQNSKDQISCAVKYLEQWQEESN
jgi:hypothetical protein